MYNYIFIHIYVVFSAAGRDWKNKNKDKKMIRRIVRESVSRHHAGTIESPPPTLNPLGPSQHYRIEGFEGGL